MGTSINKTQSLYLKNNSGQTVTKGDVVTLDKNSADSFTLTGSAGYSTSLIGVVLDQTNVAAGTSCLVAIGGYVPVINLLSGANIGDTFYLSSVAKRAQPHSTILSGDFGQALSSGLTPEAVLWGPPVQSTAISYPTRATLFLEEANANKGLLYTHDPLQNYGYTSYVTGTASNGDNFTLSFLLAAGTYTCVVLGSAAGNVGKLDWTLDGVSQTTGQDWYNAGTLYNQVRIFTLTVLTSGYHVLKGTINGKNAASSDFYWNLTKLYIRPAAD